MFNPVWHGPGPLNPPNCNNRGTYNYAPLVRCSSNVPGMVNRPFPLPVGRAPGFYNPHLCASNAHPAPYSVCGQCVLYTEDKQYYKQAVTRMTVPPPNPPVNETSKWRGFWTRMCRQCELREQYLIHWRLGSNGVIPPPLPANVNLMAGYPRNTCTCQRSLARFRLCTDHRKPHWDAIRNANAATLGSIKHRTDVRDWLKMTARDAVGVLCTASPARIQDRRLCQNGRIQRACRCGHEVTQGAPEVYQCMACEGIIEVTQMALPFPIPTAAQLQNSFTHPWLFQLQRPRAAHTA